MPAADVSGAAWDRAAGPADAVARSQVHALHQRRAYRDADTGIAETFLTPTLGGARTVALLSQPLDDPNGMGWVVCHSFGMEQTFTQELEATAARALAARGHTVLQFHAQGYGDSELPSEHATLRSQLQDTVEAVGILAETEGVRWVGLIGARLGATIAAQAADATGSAGLVLWNPVIDGSEYVDLLFRQATTTDLARGDRFEGDGWSPQEVLREAGVVDLQGFALRRQVAVEIGALRLLDRLRRFDGSALVLQISSAPEPRPDRTDLVALLERAGAAVSFETLVQPEALWFGVVSRYGASKTGRRVDKQAALSDAIVEATIRWADSAASGLAERDPSR